MEPLSIPVEARRAYDGPLTHEDWTARERAIRAIAGPVVAAELRRLAAEYENGRRTARCVLDLLNRANELEAK